MNTDFTTKDLNRLPTAFQQQPLPQTLYPLQTQEQWDRLPKGKLKLEDVFEAFYRCKAGKADTCNALRFEMHFERYCLELCERVNNHNYHPDRSIVFQNYSLFPWQTAVKNVMFAIQQTNGSVPKDEIERLSAMVTDVMQNVCELKVPLIADVSYGATWAEAH